MEAMTDCSAISKHATTVSNFLFIYASQFHMTVRVGRTKAVPPYREPRLLRERYGFQAVADKTQRKAVPCCRHSGSVKGIGGGWRTQTGATQSEHTEDQKEFINP